MESPYIVELSGSCVEDTGAILDNFQAPSYFVPSFKVLSPTLLVDESVRYRLTGGGRLFVARCLSSPCTSGSNFVSIGEILVSSVYGIASQTHTCSTCSAKQPIEEISKTGKSGGFSFVNGLSSTSIDDSIAPSTDIYTRPDGAILNLVAYNEFNTTRQATIFESTLNEVCQGLSASNASSLTVSKFSQTQFLGKPQCADPVTGQSETSGECVRDKYLAFTGSDNNQALTIAKPGNIAMCTCSVLTPTLACANPLYWKFFGMMIVSGPTGGQAWSVPVGTTFGLTIRGAGLGTKFAGRDFIRIIAAGTSCTSTSNQPLSVAGIKLGCPNCSSQTSTSSDIFTYALRSADDPTLPKIKRIQVYSSFTRLYFSSDIEPFLSTGDLVAILLDGIVVDGKQRRDSWTAIDAQRAFQISGRIRYADRWNSVCSDNCDDLVTGYPVTVETGSSNTVTIPTGLDEFESVIFSVVPGGADWERHSQLTIPESLKATVTADSYPVCWGRQKGGSILYYAQAGTLTFYQPLASTSVSLSTMTAVSNVDQPMVLSLVTNYKNNAIYQSSSAVVVKLTFLNIDKLNFVDSNGGSLFIDLSTNDGDGFPQPQSWTVSSVITDLGIATREIKIFFPESSRLKSICTLVSGVRGPCTYKFAFTGRLGATLLLENESVIRVDIMSPTAVDPYYTFETGTVKSPVSTIAGSASVPRIAFLSAGGSPVDSLALPQSRTDFQLGVNTSTAAVGVLKLFLGPVLQWDISTTVACSPSCSIEKFGGSRNVIKLTLDSPIAPNTQTTITVGFNSTSWLPSVGSFSNQVFAEIDGTAFAVVATNVSVAPTADVSHGTGRILPRGLTGDGQRPFIGQAGDVVETQFKLARSLMGLLAVVRLQLPVGFTCIPPTGWSVGATVNECKYQLANGELWPANAWQSANLTVVNPSFSLTRSDSRNIYSITVDYGDVSGALSVPGFSSVSRAVIRPLSYSVIQPSNLVAGEVEEIYVFVSTMVQMNQNSSIVIFAPSSFQLTCSLELLDLALMPVPSAIRPFFFNQAGVDLSCSTTSSGSVTITTARVLSVKTLIGFKLRISNPYSATDEGWNIFTFDPTGEPLQGSKTPVGYGGRQKSSWQVYPTSAGPNILITPSVLSVVTPSMLTITGLSSATDLYLGSLSVQLPDSFSIVTELINPSQLEFKPAAIQQDAHNRIVFLNVSLTAGEEYSIPSLPITVPASIPEWTAYYAYVEIRDFTGLPVGGSVLPFSLIRAVSNLIVDYQNSLVGASNLVTLRFDLRSDLVQNDTITISFVGGKFQFNPGTIVRTFSTSVQIESSTSENVVLKSLSPMAGASTYQLKLSVTNSDSVSDIATWTVATSKDHGASLLGPTLLSPLNSAFLLPETPMRNDRFGWINRLVFDISMPSEASTVIITGPPGFVYSDNCTSDVEVSAATVVDCRGTTFDISYLRTSISILLAEPFTSANVSFWVRNPIIRGDPTLDFWNVNVENQFGSNPIPTFLLRDFSYFNVSLSNYALSGSVSYPIEFAFSPKQSLPVTNTGRLLLRSDTLGLQYGVLNVSANSGLRVQLPATGFAWDASAKTWDLLLDEDTREHFLIGKNELYLNRTSSTEIYLYFTGSKTLLAGHNYTFTTNVFTTSNGETSSEFRITSLKPLDLIAVDESTYSGIGQLGQSISTFQVTNLDSNLDPNSIVRTQIVVTGLEPVQGNVIEIIPPTGFTMLNGTSYIADLVRSLSVSVLVQNAPFMSTNVTETYWKVNAQNTSQSGATLSWRVVGPLSSLPQVTVVSGLSRGAGSTTSIALSLVGSSDANYVYLNISNPQGFNFSRTTGSSSACWNCIGVGDLDIRAGFPQTVRIDNVLLGQVGGDVTFSVQTFYVPPELSSSNPLAVPSMARDRAIDVIGGFFLSGSIAIRSSELSDQSFSGQPSYVSDALNPRINNPSLLKLSGVSFSLTPASLQSSTGLLNQPIRVRFLVSLPSQIYTLSGGLEIEPSIGSVVFMDSNHVDGTLTVDIACLASQLRRLTSQSYTITIPVVPLVGGQSSASLAIDMYVNGTLLNTNDESTNVPSASSSVAVETLRDGAVSVVVSSAYIPPNIQMNAVIHIDASLLPIGTNRVRVFAPLAFRFVSTSIGIASQNVVTVSISSTSLSVNVQVVTAMMPSQSALPWIALAFTSNTLIGWRELPPVVVEPLPFINVLYGGTSGLLGAPVVVDFSVRSNDTVSSIEIIPPSGSVLRCNSQYLVAFITCTAPSTNQAGLTLNTTSLQAGRYTVPLTIDLPITTPPTNFFDITLRNSLGVNVDGIYGFPGESIVDSTILDVANVAVTVARNTQVNVSFSLITSTTYVDAINLQFPPGYYHTITDPTMQVKSVNRKFPRRSASEWLYTNVTDSITFLVDDTKANILEPVTGKVIKLNNIIGGETYTFIFPVVVASTSSIYQNYWILSFCQSRYQLDSCKNMTHSTSIAQFPVFV